VLSTDDESWVVKERGAILPSEKLPTEGLTPLDADAAVELVATTWGAAAAFAKILRASGPDPVVRVRTALEAALAESVTSTHDLRVAGFID
jgi:hypothetical protein